MNYGVTSLAPALLRVLLLFVFKSLCRKEIYPSAGHFSMFANSNGAPLSDIETRLEALTIKTTENFPRSLPHR
uniref:Putative secreted protein n=1 Tax=Anopheles darlingi TaxID=43151 RepID=A0A2M4DBA5_ANODA